MTTQYISEIRICAFTYAPRGWALCNGQLLGINQNQALFSLLGTSFGGDGRNTFGLPNLQGKIPMHIGPEVPIGATAGVPNVTLSTQQMPIHLHQLQGSLTTTGTTADPTGTYLGQVMKGYGLATATPLNLLPDTISSVGLNQPHTNMMPYLAVNFCIALVGIFPSRN